MFEVVIERWTGPDGATEYRWSLWRDGYRVEMGNTAFPNADD